MAAAGATAAALAFLAFLTFFTFLAGLAAEASAAGAAATTAGVAAALGASGVAAKDRAATPVRTVAAIRDLIFNMVGSHFKNDSRCSFDHLKRAPRFLRACAHNGMGVTSLTMFTVYLQSTFGISPWVVRVACLVHLWRHRSIRPRSLWRIGVVRNSVPHRPRPSL